MNLSFIPITVLLIRQLSVACNAQSLSSAPGSRTTSSINETHNVSQPYKPTSGKVHIVGTFMVHWRSGKKLFACINPFKPSSFFTYHQVFNIQKFYMVLALRCFVRISEQTATLVLYIINWLVFITVVESVYSAVRTGSLNKAVCASSLKGYLRTNSDLCHLQHKMIGFYNRHEKCLQRGTDWFLI
jgi:hypothetical protein